MENEIIAIIEERDSLENVQCVLLKETKKALLMMSAGNLQHG